MDYELAKELKDAGFRQSTNPLRHILPDGMGAAKIYPESAYVPTLEELIEACGHRLLRLQLAKDGPWVADVRDDDIETIGSTPTEAVARLWLALQKK